MKNGLARFEFYLIKLEDLLSQSGKERNAALFLYNNDARTTIFMLEGLSKLYAGLHNKKRFTKLKNEFKLLEDALGNIDYYDSYAKEFNSIPAIPAEITNYMLGQTREKLQHLNDLLMQRSWVGENGDRIKKIRKKLKNANWLKDDKEVIAITGFYKQTIRDINQFFAESKGEFTEIELQVHSLRRKLRWLSIYPRSLQGLIQLTENSFHDDHLVKYLTADIINSPYNKMPDAGNNRYFLMLGKNYFLALSWMIDALGKLKDNGLRIVAITEAIQQMKSTTHDDALFKTYEILGPHHPGLTTILSESYVICTTYFKEQNLDKLLAGIATTS